MQTILTLRDYINKNKYENIVYKNYNNSQINIDVNTIGSKIWDIVWLAKFKTSKVKKHDIIDYKI